MADTPENPPKKAWSAAEYRRRVAEREANRTPEEKAQDDADAASGLQRVAEQFARGSLSLDRILQKSRDDMVKAAIDGARSARIQRKADAEEAFDNALKKSEDRARVAGSLAPTSPKSDSDEIQAILSEQDLWDFSYVEIGQSYSQRRREYAWERLGKHKKGELIAGAIIASLAALVTGVTWDSVFRGVAAAVITLVGILIALLLGYWLYAPKPIDEALQGDLEAANNQLKEEKRKLHRVAERAARTIEHWKTTSTKIAAERDEEINERAKLIEIWETSKRELGALKGEANLLRTQLASSYKVVLDVDTVGCSAEVNPPQRSRVNFVPVPGDDNEWSTGCLLADIRMRFDSSSETTRVRINSVVAFLVIGTSQRPADDVHYFVGENWASVDFEDEAYSHMEPLKKSPYYLMSCSYDLGTDEIEQLKQNIGMVRLVMDAANQPNYCVDLAIGHWDEIETSLGSAVTVLKKGGCSP